MLFDGFPLDPLIMNVAVPFCIEMPDLAFVSQFAQAGSGPRDTQKVDIIVR